MKQLFVIPNRQHGSGKVVFQWEKDGNYLATCGRNGLLNIFDRHGDRVAEVPLEHSGSCLALDWDRDGELVAVLQEGNAKVPIFDMARRKLTFIETNLKDPTWLKWSKIGPQLAVGTAKGNLLIYRKDSRKNIPVMGKHSKAITCGAWSADNKLALGGADEMLTLSHPNGDTIEQTELKYPAVDIQFATQKTDGRSRQEGGKQEDSTVSVNMGGKTVLLYNLDDVDNPVELAFQPRYGSIVTYRWFGDGYMMIGFSEGWMVVISTHMREIGEELFSGRFHKETLDDIAFSQNIQRAATAGGNQIKLLDMSSWKELPEDAVQLDPSHGGIERMAWTQDGQILTAATRNGAIFNFVASMPSIFDCAGTRIGFMSSLRELSLIDVSMNTAPQFSFEVPVEPTFVAIGPRHAAVGMNNRAWFHDATKQSQRVVNEQEYLSTVQAVRLGAEHAAVLAGGRVTVHPINPSMGGDETRVLPESDSAAPVTCIAMAPEILVYGADDGRLEFFYLPGMTPLSGADHQHKRPITAVYPNNTGTRVIFRDDTNEVFMYNPVDSRVLPIPSPPPNCSNVMWDMQDDCCFVVTGGGVMHSYLFVPVSRHGPQIVRLGAPNINMETSEFRIEPQVTPIPASTTPLCVIEGSVTVSSRDGKPGVCILQTHAQLHRGGRVTGETQRSMFLQYLTLHRLRLAWDSALVLDNRSYWLALANKAMDLLQVDIAVNVYRHLGDAGMVMSLESVMDLEDVNLLAGHLSVLFNEFSQAQDLFLSSSDPICALQLRRDLFHWDQALRLAETLSPEQVPELSLEYAKQLEFKGEYQTAYNMFQNAQMSLQAGSVTSERPLPPDEERRLMTLALGGLARMKIRLGEIRQGINMANESGDKQLCKECAAILESMKQYSDAANLYNKAEQYDKAVAILILTKNFGAAAPLMKHITQPKLHSAYAKAKEASQDYMEAAVAYERARDMDNFVRVLLQHLNQPERASEIVRSTKSSVGAQLVSEYCQSVGDFRGAIEFLMMANRSGDAFELARKHNEMSIYADAIGDGGTQDEYSRIARYYQARNESANAAKYYTICGDYKTALELYLQCGDSELDPAIDVVGKAKDDMLTHQLIDFLMGETDGLPKDPNYIFRLYMALGNFEQAVYTALIIAKQEQELGNYKAAHDVLFETYQELVGHDIRVPQKLMNHLRLIHSYVMVKRLVKLNDHSNAAQNLVHVAKNVSKFPAHVVPILTSTVIECQRAGLKKTAYEYATQLMRPENRGEIDQKLRRRIETLVRRPNKEEAEPELSECPVSGQEIPVHELTCPTTRDALPWCIITSRHMTLQDWSFCPVCKFPALHSYFVKYLPANENICPMCSNAVNPSQVNRVSDPRPLLRKLLKAGDGAADDDDEAEEGKQEAEAAGSS